jgi:hypothetical protein
MVTPSRHQNSISFFSKIINSKPIFVRFAADVGRPIRPFREGASTAIYASQEGTSFLEPHSERTPRSLLRGVRANLEMADFLTVEDPLQLAAGSFNQVNSPPYRLEA